MKSAMKSLGILLLLAPIAALAHVHLEGSTPAKNSVLKASPEKVILVFEEAVELKALTVQRTGDSLPKLLGPLSADYKERFEVPLPKLRDGQYTISYTYIGSDTHQMTATIPFKVSAAGATAASAPKK